MDEGAEAAWRLGLLASAISGRRLEVTPAEPDDATWTNGHTIHLARGLTPPDAVQAVSVQAALIAAGSLSPEVLDSLRRDRGLCPRYLAVEGSRALTSLRDVLPAAAQSFVLDDEPATTSAEQSLQLAASNALLPSPPIVFGELRPRSVTPPTDHHRQDATVPTALRETRVLREIDDAADLDELDRSTADDLSSPVGGGGAIGRLLQRLTTGIRSRDAGSPGADAATQVARRGLSGARRTGTTSLAAATSDAVEQLSKPAARSYPEWDCYRERYRLDWCTVRERDAPPPEVADLGESRRELHRALARVMPDLDRVHRRLQGNDLDIDAVVSEQVDLRAGGSPDESVYVDQVRRRRDLAVMTLLDVSASAAEPSQTGAPVHHHQRATAAALVTTLHRLGDRVALSTFRSMGRNNVEVVPIKQFGEPAGAAMLGRLAALTPGAYTRLGAAIRHGCATLEAQAGTSRRLLIVVSDGFAYDHGYEGRYGEADARRALAEARRAGIGCLCLSVGGVTEADALTRVFGTAAHATIGGIDHLSGVVARLFPAALRSAEHRRRTWQHRTRSSQRQQLDRRTA